MIDTQSPRELRIRRGSSILAYIRQFSATEKVVFGAFAIMALTTTIVMAAQINGRFLTAVPTRGGDLREGEVGLPRTANPVLAITDVDQDISALAYSGLIKYRGGEAVPDLAESWTISDDGLTYDFILKSGLRFQDGAPLTADDVAFTIQKIQDPALKSPHQADWANVGVKEISPTEIQFTLKQPYSPFLSNASVGILPKHIWSSVNDDEFIFSSYNIQPIGSGPYRVKSIARDQGGIPTDYELVPWNGYYGNAPYIATISLRFFSDKDAALNALNQGSIDSLSAVSPSSAAALASDSAESYRVLSAPLPRIFGVFFDQSQSPALADKKVRAALDASIDRDAIVRSVLSGYGIPMSGPLPSGLSSTTGTSDGLSSDDRIAAAQAALEKDGWTKDADGIYAKKTGKSSSVTLSFDIDTADAPDLKQAAELVKQSWSALGADVDVKVFEPSDLYQNIIRARAYEALLFGEQIGTDRDLYAFWHSSQRNAPGLNVALYASSQADKLLSEIRSTQDDSKRQADYAALDSTIRSDIPAIFLYAPDFIYVVPKALRGVDIDSMTVPADRWSSVEDWYLATEDVWNIFVKDAGQNDNDQNDR